MKRLESKTVIVTGSSKGIGKGIALAMAKEGANVVVNYSSSKEAAEVVVEEIKERGAKAIMVQANVSKKEDVEKLFSKAIEAFGSVDVLVNNAGAYHFEPLEAVTEERYREDFDSNVLGPILTTQEAVKYFKEKGNIINIGSVISLNPTPYSMVYSATKNAVVAITEVAAKELGPKGIRVNAILPGLTETDGTHQIGVIGSDNEKMMVANTPLGRIAQPDDVAKVAVFLASEDSAWITGEKISVSGGL